MNKFQNFILAVLIASPSLVMAQPPEEELSPTAPEFNIEVMDAPAPADAIVTTPVVAAPAAPAAQPATPAQAILTAVPAAPITELKAPEAPAEDKSLKGVTLSPSITLKPLGYNGERHQSFIEVSPSVGLGTVFKTGSGRDVSMNLSYAFIWDEFLSRRDNAFRYFEHDISGDATIDWTKSFSTTASGEFNYSFWASDAREFGIFNEEYLKGIFKINKDLTVTTGYHLFYFNDLDSEYHLSDGNLPSDGDDVRQGNSAIGGASQFYADPNSDLFNYDPAVGNTWFANNGLVLNSSYKVTSTTKIGAEYEYVFTTFTNTDATNWRGHFFVASISQDLPWKGGSVSLKDQIRLRNFRFATNDDGSLVSNFRNRLTLVLGQAINDTISAQLWYRWQLTGSNADNYGNMEGQHQVNLGFTFSF